MVDIEKNAFILSLGIDTVSDIEDSFLQGTPESPPNKVHVTMEILIPRLLKRNQQKTTIVLHQDGNTIESAIKLAQSQISRKLNLSHLQLVMIGEEYGKKGIKNLCNYLIRNPQIANRIKVCFIQNERAESTLMLPVVTEENVATIISKMGDLEVSSAFHRALNFNEMYHYLKNNNGTTYGVRYYINDKNQLVKNGAAILKDHKIVGWLDSFSVRGTNWITGKLGQAIIATSVTTTEDNNVVTYNVSKVKSSIEPSITNEKISFLITIKTRGNVVDLENYTKQINHQVLKGLEQAIALKIKKEAKEAINLAQNKYKADYLHFGENLFDKYPQYYEKLDWEEKFLTVPIDVRVESKIIRIGLKR